MRRHGMFLLFAMLAGGIAIATHAAHAEEYRGTFAQRLACTPDVLRLCGSAVPDVARIVACLMVWNGPSKRHRRCLSW
ncbi:hypothetical protein Nham_2935 [Nitrobacter hamburgensis X14]|uniref:Secreted protein n=1 Tax=Nitrobacter hamburgensis (strain DSM 10229 / NCIMB 13809 / X14) TaxID=323097 RepID=Q1QJ96_NITHX|nr:hypothetical protein Nham_2935 [Nitrobacter hamburgensis X14]